jgi:hypothetical protein
MALAGVLLPLISWNTTSVVATVPSTIKTHIIQSAVETKSQAVAVMQPHITSNWDYLQLYIYIAGLTISLLFILKDCLLILRLYKNGVKVEHTYYTLIETRQKHSPFSIFRLVFISNMNAYTEPEINMVLAHEERHIRKHHSIDLILTYVLQSIFWFHPFIYWFRKQLQLVHEYQADELQHNTANEYGRFLIMQVLSQTAPRISHSFFHSPIKNRIMMLSKSSTRYAKLKQVLVLPLLVVAVTFFSNCKNNRVIPIGGYTIKKNGDVATYKGNTIKLKITPPDKDGSTWADRPLTVNGEKVYSIYSDMYKNDVDLDTDPVFSIKDNTLKEYIFEKLKDDFDKLPDGGYNLMLGLGVVDTKGELVWYDYSSVQTLGVSFDDISKSYHHEFDSKVMAELYNAPKFAPGTVKGEAVASEFPIGGDKFQHIEVKNHHAILCQCTKYN